ncbi:hypothetical protein GCM10010357_70960 [Streptomyces luteireticuli]|uniref:DNA primase/polymerase bifunctional N-terminal domain-containing protein n=2 Tax=Streptomyces luteireticuli TaxID=173858 RepID=A0ABP3J5Z2_9ACTN
MPDAVAALVERYRLAVFPLPPGGRRPALPGWHGRCLHDAARVRETWRAGQNVGVGCRASGLVGLDLDGPEGAASFAALCAAHGQPVPATLTVRTPHGRHLYFRAPAGRFIGSVSGGRAGLGPGIDTRGPGRRTGGYLIGPGSVVGGLRYTVVRDAPVLDLPAWLTDRLSAPARCRSSAPAVGGPGRSRAPYPGETERTS